ncbi:MAG: hypothetical protein KDA45_07575, partial [Planctomycetales bacterium]|nr:hypothetical protein [Planctomycetales bacterium]
MSALPDSFEETNFHEPRFQASGAFTSDYDRVGPEIRRNTLLNNSINGLFVRVETPTPGLTLAGRFDDIDIVHVLTDNLMVQGAPGGSLLDSTTPPVSLISLGPQAGGTLLPGTYNYKVTFVDRNGYESIPSDASASLSLQASQTAISVAGLPSASGDFIERKLYRSQSNGAGPYVLVAKLDRGSSTYLDLGKTFGGTLSRDRASVSAVQTATLASGTLAAGSYVYRIVMVDAGGREGLASQATNSTTLVATGSVQLANLPLTLAGYAGRRIYRSAAGGTAPYVLVGELLDTNQAATTTFVDNGTVRGGQLSAESFGVKRPRLNASLVIDPGTVLKLESARIEATIGANIIAEGTDGLPIVFTSRLDDTVGAGGTFDTNNNGATTGPAPRDWGGIYMAPTSRLSVDHARFAYGGGVTKLESTFRAFNTIELHQADARIAHSVFEHNADGFGGQGPGTRYGRLSNEQSTIFVRGTQPTIIGNVFRDNAASVIDIDANSMTDDILPDLGRQTGAADRDPNFAVNRGPLIRNNRLQNNGINGLEIRGDTLTTASVWDDTDIVHVVYEEIFTGNVQHEAGLRLQSAPNESLVVKFDGYGSNFNRNLGAGLTANGQLTSATDRVGGMLHVVGQPGFPVILTSLFDDTVGAGLRPDGKPQGDTNNDGIDSIPQAADWRGLLLDQYSNDRNVSLVLETESFTAAAPGPNGDVRSAQVLGELASSLSAGNEDHRLGFVVEGVLSQSEDIDIYSFSGTAGTEVWLDVDYTQHNMDLVLELLDANGTLLARSDNSTAEIQDPSLLFVSPLMAPGSVQPVTSRTTGVRTTSGGAVYEDGSTNPLDPGMRVRLPGTAGSPSTYYFRVRSASTNADSIDAGLSSGAYQVQVRLREQQEWAGSTINYADIRYAMNGVHLRGLPGESPLVGEAAEDESVRNGRSYSNNGVASGNGIGEGFVSGSVDRQIGNRPQYVGNLLNSAKGAISIAGEIASSQDVDFYMLEINQEDLVGNLAGGYAPVVFDLDYADGLNRPDTSLNIFREESTQVGVQYRLIYTNDSSNVADDQGRPLTVNDMVDMSRGSLGTGDAYIGPVALPAGNYVVGVSSASYQPRAKLAGNFKPITSIRRLVDEGHISGSTNALPPVVQNFLPRRTLGSSDLVSKTFDLGRYAAADLPAMYLDITHPADDVDLYIVDSAGDEFQVASTTDASLLQIPTGSSSLKIPLNSILARGPAGLVQKNFAGEDGLSLVFRGDNVDTTVTNLIIGFAERGESVTVSSETILLSSGSIFVPEGIVSTRQFSLESYQADQPSIQFNYRIQDGQLDVFFINDATGFEQRIATSVSDDAIGNEPVLITGNLQQTQAVRLPISPFGFGDVSQLRVEFRARDDDPSVAFISNAFVRLADGSLVGAGGANSTYTSVVATGVTAGKYQLEIRLGEEFFQSRSFGAPLLTKSFDTNDRLAEQISIEVPAGSEISDGDRYQLSDGGNNIVFEFTTDANVGLGNVPVNFTASDPNYVVARALRDAINLPGVQSRLAVQAATSSGI